MHKIKILVLITFLVGFCLIAQPGLTQDVNPDTTQSINILSRIAGMSDVTINETKIDIAFRQPVDHNNPQSPEFEQHIVLIHKDINKPVVLWLEGYGMGGAYEQEITKILDANQITVEHRYFGESVPDSMDWDKLTIRQAAGDHHRIVESFKKIYKGPWLSAGISKGGQTTMYHRRFYPDDVDASVCYVAPLNFSLAEPRIDAFLDSVGDAETRRRIRAFQEHLLANKDAFLPLFRDYCRENDFSFAMGTEAAFEFTVLEYPFSYWQWHTEEKAKIPADSASVDAQFEHFVRVSDPYFFSDQGMDDYLPFFHQAATQIGFYGYDINSFNGLLDKAPAYDFVFRLPENRKPEFDPAPMRDIDSWIKDKAENMIFIYGALDPWGASGVELFRKDNMLKMVLDGGSHATRIKDFSDEQKQVMYDALESWLGVEVNRAF